MTIFNCSLTRPQCTGFFFTLKVNILFFLVLSRAVPPSSVNKSYALKASSLTSNSIYSENATRKDLYCLNVYQKYRGIFFKIFLGKGHFICVWMVWHLRQRVKVWSVQFRKDKFIKGKESSSIISRFTEPMVMWLFCYCYISMQS